MQQPLSQATREIMWNISHVWILYTLFGITLLVFGFGVYKRIQFWMKGKSDNDRLTDLPGRFVFMVKEVLFQNKVRNSLFPAIFHSFFFYSFLVLLITTAVVALDYDFGTSLFKGYIYVVLSLGSEIGGTLILIGILMAAWRRYLQKPKTLETNFSDTWSLAILAIIIITGFLAEGIRIVVAGDPWKAVSPVGYGISLLFKGINPATGAAIHAGLWWTHTIAAFTWIATIPFTKFVHVLTLPANAFLSKMKPAGELNRIDLEALMESDDFDEDNFTVGMDTPKDFTWKLRMDLDACVSCGRCEEMCPAFAADQPLSPKKFISAMKALMYDTAQKGEQPAESAEIVGNAFEQNFIWYCRTCMACVQACPAFITHVDSFIDIRRNEVNMKGRIPAEAGRALKSMENQGNPFGSQMDRVDWVKTLDAPVLEEGGTCDVLYWIGCLTTFDPTKQKIASDLIRILKTCGIDVAVLGKAETCCGDPARVCGDENLFQTTAKMQVEELNARKFNTLLTSCPHCYNTLRNEYPQFGGKFNVVHHSEFLNNLIASGKLKPKQTGDARAVYHDPCYLGRYQKIYDAPRSAIRSALNSAPIEMKNTREKSFCCGGGGGHFWMDFKDGERINKLRVKQVQETGADTIITACPFCLHMLDDALKMLNLDENIKIKDIAGLFS